MTPTVSNVSRPATLRPMSQRAFRLADVQWSRPVFKAPPLSVKPPVVDIRDFIGPTQERMAAGR
jgi:hypothetical protein